MAKPEIPTHLVREMRAMRPPMTYKEISLELKRRGYPPAPFPAFNSDSVQSHMSKQKRHYRNPGYEVLPE